MEIHVPVTQPMYCSKSNLSDFFGSVKSELIPNLLVNSSKDKPR